MGTVINVATVLVGSLLGIVLHSRFSDRLKDQMLQGIGLVTILIGVQMGLKSENILYPLAGILIGGMIGYVLKLELGLERLAAILGERFAKKSNSANF